ncbi:MAG: PhoH family protein [Nanoarchaeota archaeon]|nr:PhoH family protein [Nanoarchaeota archaeon]
MKTKMQRDIVVGLDVVENSGTEIFSNLDIQDGEVVTIYFDRKNAEKQGELDNPLVREFMNYGHKEGERNQEGGWEIDNGDSTIILRLKSPDSWENCQGMTDDPSIREHFYDKGIKRNGVIEPKFLKVDPSILKKGFETRVSDLEFDSLENRLDPVKEGIHVDFPNQFLLLTLEGDRRQALYMVRKDFKTSGPDMEITSDMYLQRIEPNTTHFLSDNKSAFEGRELAFGIKANHLSQYLAWKYLLLDPNIQFVTLSGQAGSGKTLLGYMSGLEQTILDDESKVNKEYLYKMMRLLKPAVPPTEHQVGFLPGDLGNKLGPQMDSFKTLHEEDIIPEFSYKDALEIQQLNKWRTQGFYFPTNKVPLLKEDTVAFAKGSTWSRQMIIVDEAEDLQRGHGQGLVTRIGFGSKMVFCGDPFQTHNPKTSPYKNALVHMAYKLAKEQHPGAAMMNLERTNRSPIANLAATFHMPR